MYTSSQTKEYFIINSEKREKLRKRNSFYYDYVENLVNFLVPTDKKLLRIVNPTIARISESETYDYVAASDVLGYIQDISGFLSDIERILRVDGRIVITQYSQLWEPVLRVASALGLRMPSIEQNWLSKIDIKNFLNLAGFEIVKSGSKVLCPVYIPIIGAFFNNILANIFPFNRLGLINYAVARKIERKLFSPNPSLSIVVPARNEKGTIEKISKELPKLGMFTELIFIEGNSTDDTWTEIERVASRYGGDLKIKIARQDGKGKGDAVRKGFDMAEGDILAIYDADMTVPASDIKQFYDAIVLNRADFINGSRLVYPLEKQSMRLLNYFGNKFFSFAFSAILGQPLKDTLCGTKVLWAKDYETIKRNRHFFGNFDPFGDFDLLFGAAKSNLKIIDLPVHYKERKYGATNISRWSHGWLLLKMTLFAARRLKFR